MAVDRQEKAAYNKKPAPHGVGLRAGKSALKHAGVTLYHDTITQ